LASAVKKILRGHQREQTERLIAFRSHWGFESEFCNRARGNEKGGVEGEVGYFRRNHLVPVPQARDLEELNRQLLVECREYERRQITGKPQQVGAAMATEREYLLPLAAEGFDLAETSFPTVDGQGCVKARTNFYSTPLRPGTEPRVRLLASHVEVWRESECVARHERSYGRYQQVLDLQHYLQALERKPGALAGSTALAQWREQGRWPASYDLLWDRLRERHGKQEGTREMIGLLALGKRHGWDRLREAVESALAAGCADAAAVRHLVETAELRRAPAAALEVGELSCYQRPMPALGAYDLLLEVRA
jgi:hypothetical protein